MERSQKWIRMFEIRVKEGGELLLKGSIPYLSESEILYSAHKKGLMKERIAPMAFGQVLKETGKEPLLLLNHQYHKQEKVKEFHWNDTKSAFEFEFLLEPSIELLQNISQIGAISFGFVEGDSRWLNTSNDTAKPYDWERTILSFTELREISILLHKQQPAYPSAMIYVGDSETPLSNNERDQLLEYMRKTIQQLRRKEVEELKRVITSLRG
ncbi:MAG: hypothetical protein Q4F05_02465 [bacterium]|nr:hypothetical protein [bacterium]